MDDRKYAAVRKQSDGGRLTWRRFATTSNLWRPEICDSGRRLGSESSNMELISRVRSGRRPCSRCNTYVTIRARQKRSCPPVHDQTSTGGRLSGTPSMFSISCSALTRSPIKISDLRRGLFNALLPALNRSRALKDDTYLAHSDNGYVVYQQCLRTLSPSRRAALTVCAMPGNIRAESGLELYDSIYQAECRRALLDSGQREFIEEPCRGHYSTKGYIKDWSRDTIRTTARCSTRCR